MTSEPRPPERRERPPTDLAPDGPTELVEGNDGELVERLSARHRHPAAGLADRGRGRPAPCWPPGSSPRSSCGSGWAPQHLFGAPGFYVALFGATGPTLLWLTGRAQGHSLGWFVVDRRQDRAGHDRLRSSAVIALGLLMVGAASAPGSLPVSAILVCGLTLVLSMLWALATWSADRYIASGAWSIRGRS